MNNNCLLPAEMIKNIPIVFAPLLVTGYHIPINQIVPEHEIDDFLDRNPHLIEEMPESFRDSKAMKLPESEKKYNIVEKVS